MDKKIFTLEYAGRTLSATFSPLAQRADASCMLQYGDTTALVTLVAGKQDKEGIDFFPLTVDYEEKYYAAGKIYGSRFVRRETRPTEAAILTGRLIDRTIRPLFDHHMRKDVQIVVTVLSIDRDNDPDFLGLLGASLVASLSSVPFHGPVAGVRIASVHNTAVVLPTYAQREEADIDLFVGGTKNKMNMIECGAKEAHEADIVKLHIQAHDEIKKLIAWQEDIIKQFPVTKMIVSSKQLDDETKKLVDDFIRANLEKTLFGNESIEGGEKINGLYDALSQVLVEHGKQDLFSCAQTYVSEAIDALVHTYALERGTRVDGRALDQIRQLEAQVGVVPRAHGTGLFMRGMTHALSVVTLGAPGDYLVVQGMEVNEQKRFIHQYNFPAYSTGETGPFRGPGRREIGHGALAEKAIAPFIPSKDEFPYTIRVVTELMSSNGSTSMASVCGTSLALMDAGVPIKKHVAGISIGLMSNASGDYVLLTDIQGPEDHYGDMDCKIAGTRDGITAMQMDVKVEGITPEILKQALDRAQQARMLILDVMEKTIACPRAELSIYAPRVIIMHISKDKIGDVIGPGGKIIRGITERTGASIDIEEDGTIFVTGENKDSAQQAVDIIQGLTKEFTVGEIVDGTVVKILDFGAVVEIGPNAEGLLHISELTPERVNSVEDVVQLGQKIQVKVTDVMPGGKIRLSLRQMTHPGQERSETPRQPYNSRPRFDNRKPHGHQQ